jgi:hypothetical protein
VHGLACWAWHPRACPTRRIAVFGYSIAWGPADGRPAQTRCCLFIIFILFLFS